jgi:hypothetical protein
MSAASLLFWCLFDSMFGAHLRLLLSSTASSAVAPPDVALPNCGALSETMLVSSESAVFLGPGNP